MAARPEQSGPLEAGGGGSPEGFLRAFVLSLAEPEAGTLAGLFAEGKDLQAQARTLHALARRRILADRRVYSAPDQNPVYALLKLRLDPAEEGDVLLLGLRIKREGRFWRIQALPQLAHLAQPGSSRREKLRFEMDCLQGLMEGVPEFVAEMSALYQPSPTTPR